jgi:hypothetical protein
MTLTLTLTHKGSKNNPNCHILHQNTMTMYLKPPFEHKDVSLVLYIYYHNVLDEVLPTLT